MSLKKTHFSIPLPPPLYSTFLSSLSWISVKVSHLAFPHFLGPIWPFLHLVTKMIFLRLKSNYITCLCLNFFQDLYQRHSLFSILLLAFVMNGYWILCFFCIFWDYHMFSLFNLLVWAIKNWLPHIKIPLNFWE